MEEEKEIRFSVIITAYNIEKYIEKSIESARNQIFKNYEIIVIDDCSTDQTLERIKRFKDIKVIEHKENKCLGGARNSGVKNAIGEYIIFLDGDDYLNNEQVLEKLDKLIDRNTPDVIYLGFELTGKKEGFIIPTPENCTKTYRIAGDRYANAWSKCWKKEFLTKNKLSFPENRYYEDVIFIYRAISKVETYLIADFPTHTYYSGRPNSITTNVSFKNIHDNLYNIEELMNFAHVSKTEELDIKIEKEVQRCKERLEEIYDFYKGNLNKA
ncbi:MAG: glycosyltransferase family 2 protein [Clostridia bacterium]|nr:glycosyltransferase family 2 protein [Clostridia bacterium]